MIMETTVKYEPIVCRVCNGDPRASAKCSACHGAGIGLQTEFGYLVWLPTLDAFTFRFRQFRLKANAIIHLTIGLLIVACLTAATFGFLRMDDPTAWLAPSFWISGHWYVALLWLGLLLGCFLIFRLGVYANQVHALPNWGKTKKQVENNPISQDAAHATDVSLFFQPAAWQLLERAFGLAEKLGRTELLPVHVFAAALSSPAGGIFMTRLGMDFEKIKEGLVRLLKAGQPGSPTVLSAKGKLVLLSSFVNAAKSRRRYVGVIELFLEAFAADESLQEMMDAAGYPPQHVTHVGEWIRIQELMREEHDRFVALAALKPKNIMNRTMTAQQTPLLDQFSEDLTLLARSGYIAPTIGREREMEEILRGIESGRRSVVLVGDSGVGKSAFVETLARRMVEEDVPRELFDRRLVSIQLPQLLSTGDPHLVAERLLAVLHEVAISGNIILVVQGIEALVGGRAEGPMDLAETFAAELDKGYFIAIATTTPHAWTSYLERRTIGQKLVRIAIPEMEPADAIKVLMAKSGAIEYQNNVFFSYGALERSVQLAKRYLTDQRLPESAMDIAKEAAVIARKEHGDGGFVTAEDVARVVHEKTNIPVEAVSSDESQKLLNLETKLHGRVIGQDDAVKAVSQALRRARAEVREGKRPIANFLFLGPTGVGKTELTKALAAEYFGSESSMIRLDMSEYQDRSAVARVIGEPGDERGGLLTEAVRKNPFAIVLLDELEKAHPDILTLFLQVMDDGRLTDGVGRTVDFTNVVLIATSNAGTPYIQEQVMAGTPLDQIRTGLLERELKGIFRPEFLNRFDAVIVFKPLSLDDVTQIAWLLVNAVGKRLEEKGMGFRAEDAAVEELAQAGYDPIYGARPLRRVIQERVENALADLLLKKELNRRDTVVLEAGGVVRVEKFSS